jgi:L-cystine transport system substrate-binding protein
LIHKNDTNKAFAKEYDKAIKELQKDGTIAKLSEKYFGEDVFSYVTD